MPPGILFFALGARLCLGQVDLAVQLFEEGSWADCQLECRRVLAEEPGNETAWLLGSVAGLRSDGKLRPGAIDSLETLAKSARSLPVRSMAAYEYGRLTWANGKPDAAWQHLAFAFRNPADHDLFLRAGCSLYLLLEEHPEIAIDETLRMELDTASALWSDEIVGECRLAPPPQRQRLTAKPAQWIVSFYRTQVRPAIGSRCSLRPSCSEYFRQASQAHGLLAFPMIGDRLVREPSVVKDGTLVDGRYPDPLSDHDRWLKR